MTRATIIILGIALMAVTGPVALRERQLRRWDRRDRAQGVHRD